MAKAYIRAVFLKSRKIVDEFSLLYEEDGSEVASKYLNQALEKNRRSVNDRVLRKLRLKYPELEL